MDEVLKIIELFDEDEVTTADKIDRPQSATDREMFQDFNDRNPKADGGMLVKPSTDGSRPGYAKATTKKTRLTGEKFIETVEKFPDKTNRELLEYFNKNNYVNRFGDPLTPGAIKTQKSKFFDIAAETKSKIPKGYGKSTEVFENLPISKKDYFRVKQATDGAGTLLTKEIDKLLKPVKIGETFYFKKPNKTDLKSFSRLSDRTGRLSNEIVNLMLDFDKSYGNIFAKGNIPDIEKVSQRFGVTDSTAGKATLRLAQWYGGKDFKNPELQNLKRNKVASNRMFKTIEKSPFGNPYRQGLYEIALQTIDEKLGNDVGTFSDLKIKARKILKQNNIPVYDPKMGKDAFGFNINEVAGVTGSAKSKAAEFSQFVDVMEGNLNTKALSGFQSKLSSARQIIENDPSQLSSQSKKINRMAQGLEEKYGVELPRLRDPDAAKYFSPARLRELNRQGLDIVKAAERAGYTVQMPKSAVTIQEFVKQTPKVKNILQKIAVVGCGPKAARVKAAKEGGRIDFNVGGSTECITRGLEKIKSGTNLTPGDQANIRKLNDIAKTAKGARAMGSAARIVSGLGLGTEAALGGFFALTDYATGADKQEIISNLTYGLAGKDMQEQLKQQDPMYGKADKLDKVFLGYLTGMDRKKGLRPGKITTESDVFKAMQPFKRPSPQIDEGEFFDLDKYQTQMQKDRAAEETFAKEKTQRALERGFYDPGIGGSQRISEFAAAGGGIAGLSGGVDKGPAPESGKTPHGLLSIKNNVKKY